MTPNALPSEVAAVLGTIDPDANTAGTVDSDYADLGLFESVMGIGMNGTVANGGDLLYSIIQATSAAGAGAKAITGKAATIFDSSPASGDSDKQVIINVRGEELDIANGFRYVALRLVTGGATSDSGGVLLGFFPKHGPADDNDLASVSEIVA